MAGYHLQEINKGVMGGFSKIREEYEEAEDAYQQGAEIMLLVELSDMLGAIEAYLETTHPSIKLDDLIKMHKLTKRAIQSGARK